MDDSPAAQQEDTSAPEQPTPAQDVQAGSDFPPDPSSSDQPPPGEALPSPVKTHSSQVVKPPERSKDYV